MFKCSFTIVSNASTINRHFHQREALVGAKYCETLHCVTSMSKLSNTRLSMAQARYLNTYCVWQIFGPLHTWSIFARFSRFGSQALVALNKLWSANGFGEAWLGQQYYCWVWWLLLGSWAGPRLSQLWMIPNIIWKSFVRSFLSLCCRGPTLIALPDPYLGFKPA